MKHRDGRDGPPPEIIHEWLEPIGGAENVIDELMAAWPTSRVTCLWNDAPERFPVDRVRETWLARTTARRSKPLAVLLSMTAMRHLGYSDATWTLASSHLFAHHARFSGPARGARRYAYVYTPARYIWSPELDPRGNNLLVRAVASVLKVPDRRSARNLFSVAAISNVVADRISKYWGVTARVIYPPVDIESLAQLATEPLTDGELDILRDLPDDFLLGASRFVPYKRLDQVIALGEKTRMPVVIAGDGPLKEELQLAAQHSTTPVRFVLAPSRRLLAELYTRATAYVFPPNEDFGIMPVEAMAMGTPVVGLSVGGTSETVIHGSTGILLDNFDDIPENLMQDVRSLRPDDCVRRAREFGPDRFHEGLRHWLSREFSE